MRAATTHRSSARPVAANCWTSVVTAATTSEGGCPVEPLDDLCEPRLAELLSVAVRFGYPVGVEQDAGAGP